MSKARGLADLGNVYDDAALSNRNMVVNGAMTVAQRGTSATYSAADTFVVDRFFARGVSTGQLVITVTQEDDGPAGFSKSLKINTDTAETDLASNEQFKLEHRLEGNTIDHLAWGTSDAKTVTLSFWFKSSTTGTTAVAFINEDNDRSYVSTFTVDSADTWEYKTVTVTGPTDGTWETGTSIGVRIRWGSFGTEYHTTSTDQWNSVQDMSVSGAIDWSDTANKYFQITGVQLEVGDTATPFEHRSYGDELARCKRYYEEIYPNDHTFVKFNSTSAYGNISYEVEKRAAPSVSQSGTFKAYGSGQVGSSIVTVLINTAAPKSLQALINSGSYSSFFVRQDNAGTLKIDAEL